MSGESKLLILNWCRRKLGVAPKSYLVPLSTNTRLMIVIGLALLLLGCYSSAAAMQAAATGLKF